MEQRITQLRELLWAKLHDMPTTLDDQKKLIRYIYYFNFFCQLKNIYLFGNRIQIRGSLIKISSSENINFFKFKKKKLSDFSYFIFHQ